MGANRKLATPEAYPAAFLAALRNGSAVLYAEDLPWTIGSTAKRFRLFLALLKERPLHDLHQAACHRWAVEQHKTSLVLRCLRPEYRAATLSAPLIQLALAIGENPNTATPPAAL